MSDVIKMHRNELLSSLKTGELFGVVNGKFPYGACLSFEYKESAPEYHDEDVEILMFDRYTIQASDNSIDNCNELINLVSRIEPGNTEYAVEVLGYEENMIYTVTCLCGKNLLVPRNKHELRCTNKPVICPNCGLKINPYSLYPSTIPHDNHILLVHHKDTGHHDNDLYGGGNGKIPVFHNFTFHTEYGEGRWDDCDSWIEAVNLADAEIRITHNDVNILKEMIIEREAKI